MIARSSSPSARLRRLLAMVATVTVSAVVLAPTPATAAENETRGPTIVYSDLYLKLIAAYPEGWVLDSCGAVFHATGSTGVCTTTLQLEYFYPDGTFGKMRWYVDASSATGWSVEPDPCNGLTAEENALWAAYVDWSNGYLDGGPNLAPHQIDRYGACWGWWF